MASKKLQNQIKLLQSRQTDEWATPKDFFNLLDKEFNFTLDVCATAQNTKCKNFFTIEDDALIQPWPGNVWCNPPYSNVKGFLKKAQEELNNGNCNLAVFLTFSNTDTAWFHDFVLGQAEIRFVKGRLKFEGKNSAGIVVTNPAMRPSMVSIFRSNHSLNYGSISANGK